MKYTGSKARISKEISGIFNSMIVSKNLECYVEPFVGGANMIDKVSCPRRLGFDNNKYLISLWNKFQDGYDYPKFISREEYQKVKGNKEDYPDHYVGLVGICAAYNGNWFSSYGGMSQTKTGKVRNYYDEAVRNILKQLPQISDVEFKFSDYASIEIERYSPCLIYCDPPYKKNTKVYSKKDFDHDRFWDWVRSISVIPNFFVAVSEYHAPQDFDVIWEKQLSKMFPKQKKETPKEKLFIYKSQRKSWQES